MPRLILAIVLALGLAAPAAAQQRSASPFQQASVPSVLRPPAPDRTHAALATRTGASVTADLVYMALGVGVMYAAHQWVEPEVKPVGIFVGMVGSAISLLALIDLLDG